jgi:hypothetical protein
VSSARGKAVVESHVSDAGYRRIAHTRENFFRTFGVGSGHCGFDVSEDIVVAYLRVPCRELALWMCVRGGEASEKVNVSGIGCRKMEDTQKICAKTFSS